ncbi:MAG: pitrilysin family protein [Pseudomonadota bacterium]
MKIQEVTSPGGIKAWLVEEHSVPLVAMRAAFIGGGTVQAPDGKEGVAHFLSSLFDEGAGDLDAAAFQEAETDLAFKMSFSPSTDHYYVSFATLTANRAKSIDMFRLALTKTRLDAKPIERMRRYWLTTLAQRERDPGYLASNAWNLLAFGKHPYARPALGNSASLRSITRDDLMTFKTRVFAQDNLRVVAVGDITAAELGRALDKMFGGLPKKAQLTTIPKATIAAGPKRNVIPLPIPQSVMRFGMPGVARDDKDFFPAFLMDYMVGGGSFSSRLMEEVRVKRGLAYGAYTYLNTLDHGATFNGGVATKNEAIGETMKVVRETLKTFATAGPSPTELANAKSYLKGSYALRFDTSPKIASQLLYILINDLGLDYGKKRNARIDAVTAADIKRVAKRLLDPGKMLITIVGQPKNIGEAMTPKPTKSLEKPAKPDKKAQAVPAGRG